MHKTTTNIMSIPTYVTLILLSLFTGVTNAATPQTINYQGLLTDSAGSPIDGPVNVTFRLYDSASAGNVIWSEVQPLTVNAGLFDTKLGADTVGNPLTPAVFADSVWLTIQVNSDTEMVPREALSNSPYAFQAENAELLDGLTASEIIVAAGGSGGMCGVIGVTYYFFDPIDDCQTIPQTFSCPPGTSITGAVLMTSSVKLPNETSLGLDPATTIFTTDSVTATCKGIITGVDAARIQLSCCK